MEQLFKEVEPQRSIAESQFVGFSRFQQYSLAVMVNQTTRAFFDAVNFCYVLSYYFDLWIEWGGGGHEGC